MCHECLFRRVLLNSAGVLPELYRQRGRERKSEREREMWSYLSIAPLSAPVFVCACVVSTEELELLAAELVIKLMHTTTIIPFHDIYH